MASDTTPPAKFAGYFKVGKPISYTNKNHPLANRVIKPGVTKENLTTLFPDITNPSAVKFDTEGALILPFPHLDDIGIQVLTRSKTLIPAA